MKISDKPLAFSYTRFSTPEQALGDSERRQMVEAKAYALREGLELDERSFQDLGVSAYRGKNLKEGALRAFVEQVETGDIPAGSILIVESMDRLSRAVPRQATRTLEDLCNAGITVVTLDDNQTYTKARLDSEPTAFLIAYLVAIRANAESVNKGRRVAQAWANKRSRAKHEKLTSRCPEWMSLSADRKTFELHDDRVRIVRRVFREALQRRGQEAIARGLNEDGVPTFGRGQHWHKSTISKLIRNIAVVGRYQPHKMVEENQRQRRTPDGPEVKGYYPTIIKHADFAALQALLGQHRAAYVREGQTITNPLAGIARCGLCGGAMTRVMKGAKSKPRMVCSRAKMGAGCTYHSVLMDEIWHALNDPFLMADAPEGTDATSRLLDSLQATLLGAEEEVHNLIDAIASGGPSIELRARLDVAEANKAKLAQEERELSRRLINETPKSVALRRKALVEALDDDSTDAATLNDCLRKNLESVTFNPANPDEMEAATIELNWLHGGSTNLPIGGFKSYINRSDK